VTIGFLKKLPRPSATGSGKLAAADAHTGVEGLTADGVWF